MSKQDIECLNTLFGPNSNVKIGFRMSKFDIWPKFECQNRISNVKCDIQPEFECQNMISNIRMRYLAPIRMSKYDFECQNAIFGLNSKVKTGFRM